MNNTSHPDRNDLIERLADLEYQVRRSMIVREDMDESADRVHVDAARGCGIAIEDSATKGDLLNAVQTMLRATQKQ